jgi:adenylylsulfate kinase
MRPRSEAFSRADTRAELERADVMRATKTINEKDAWGFQALPMTINGRRAHDSPRESGGAIVWFTGLSGSGKTTLSGALAQRLSMRGCVVKVLDADDLRRTLSAGLGYSAEDREENIRRIASLAEALANVGVTVLVAAITPYRRMRQELRQRLRNYVEVYVATPLATCIARDPKGLYRRALADEIQSFTGISDLYERPLAPDIECSTEKDSVNASVDKLVAALDFMEDLPGVTYVRP